MRPRPGGPPHDHRPARRDAATRAAIAERSEALFRVGCAARWPLLAQERPPRRSLPGEVPGAPAPRGGRRDVRLPGRARSRREMARRSWTWSSGRPPGVSSLPSRWPVSSAFGASSRRRCVTPMGPAEEFRRGFRIEPGERVLLVDDILTTGGSLLAMLPAIEGTGGELLLGLVIADRSGDVREVVSPSTGARTRPRAVDAGRRHLRSGARPAPPARPACRSNARVERDEGARRFLRRPAPWDACGGTNCDCRLSLAVRPVPVPRTPVSGVSLEG